MFTSQSITARSQVGGKSCESIAADEARQRGGVRKSAISERCCYHPAPRSELSGRGGSSESFALCH